MRRYSKKCTSAFSSCLKAGKHDIEKKLLKERTYLLKMRALQQSSLYYFCYFRLQQTILRKEMLSKM